MPVAIVLHTTKNPISAAMTALIRQDAFRQQVIFTQYDEQESLGRSIEERLSEIEQNMKRWWTQNIVLTIIPPLTL